MPIFTDDEVDRQLPAGDEIFLDHVGHFVRAPETASRALARAGFAPTPVSIQVDPGSAGAQPTGTGNITAMFARGYVEVLFKTADTVLGRELDARLARYAGVHLAAFAVADAQGAHQRLAGDGFDVRPLARMQRPVQTAGGTAVAAFTVARVEPDQMPEGRIQMLTHHTEAAVWQPRWLSHPNSVNALIDVVIAVEDVREAAARFARFTGRRAVPIGGGAMVPVDRGGVLIVDRDTCRELVPDVAVPALPFMAGYGLSVRSLAAVARAMDRGGLPWRAFLDGILTRFPSELGEGAWYFVERAGALPWRRQRLHP